VSKAVLAVVERDLTTPAAIEHWRRRRIHLFREIFTPRENLPLSKWAEKEFRLSSESSGAPGRIYLDTTPYLREIMDTLTDPLVEQTVFLKPKRIGGTVVGNTWLAHTIAEDPGPMMLVLPTLGMAKKYSKNQLAPMLRDVPAIQGKVKEAKSRNSDNTILEKLFTGGSFTTGGSNSPELFRMSTMRNVWGSDVDDPNFVRNPEGDTITLAWGRTETMVGAKGYWESSPGLEDFSRIIPLYLEGDQREYYVPCPHCGYAQTLVWDNLRYKEVTEPVYVCGHIATPERPAGGCGALIPEHFKYRMNLAGKWIAAAAFTGVASFKLNGLYSPFPGAAWSKLVKLWIKAQSDSMVLQAFVNTVKAEGWKEKGGRMAPTGLQERAIDYGAEVPKPVRVLTMAVDVQDDRLEWKVKGYGPGMSSCLVAVGVIPGATVEAEVWRELDKVRMRTFTKADGTALRIMGCGIDTGDGESTDETYAYVHRRRGQRVFALKGLGKPGAPAVPKKPTKNNEKRVPLYNLGVNALKSTVFGRLRLAVPGPGYMWFPTWADAEYFKQLTSEAPRPRRKGGRTVVEWVVASGVRNEAWDLEVYCLAVLKILRQEAMLMALPWEPWVFGPPGAWGKGAAVPLPPDPVIDDDEDDDAGPPEPLLPRRRGYLDWRNR
jgi:phage terminase large subunit GpA-like protein